MDSVNEKSMRFFILGVLFNWFGVNFLLIFWELCCNYGLSPPPIHGL
jgi:hypothetical protein